MPSRKEPVEKENASGRVPDGDRPHVNHLGSDGGDKGHVHPRLMGEGSEFCGTSPEYHHEVSDGCKRHNSLEELWNSDKLELSADSLGDNVVPGNVPSTATLQGESNLVDGRGTPALPDEAVTAPLPPHTEELYGRTPEGLTPEQDRRYREIRIKRQWAFSKTEHVLGLTPLTTHSIHTGTAQPVKQRPRRTPMALREAEKEAIDNFKKQGLIRESSSPWANPVVLTPKKNGH